MAIADTNYDSRVLGLYFDGADNSTTFVDKSPNPKTVTAIGDAKIVGNVGVFDGSGDYLSVANHAELNLGSSDFTIRLKVTFTGYSGNNNGTYFSTLICKQDAIDKEFVLTVGGSANSLETLQFYTFTNNSTNQSAVASFNFALNTLYDIEVVKTNNLVYLFIDGVLRNAGGTSNTTTVQTTSTALHIAAGEVSATYQQYCTAEIDELYIWKGIALHTTDFTPPTAPYIEPSIDGTFAAVGRRGTASITAEIPMAGTFSAVGRRGISAINAYFPQIGQFNAIGRRGKSTIAASFPVEVSIDSNFIRFDGTMTLADQPVYGINSNFIAFNGHIETGLELNGAFIVFDGSLVGEIIQTVQIDSDFIQFDGALTGEPIITAKIAGNFIRFDGQIITGAEITSGFIRFDGAIGAASVDTVNIASKFIHFDGSIVGETIHTAVIDSNFIHFDSQAPFLIDSNFISFDGAIIAAELGADGLPIEMRHATVMNTRTLQVSRYEKFGPFIRVITVQGKHFAVGHDGLYEITGLTDHNFTDPLKPVPVNGRIATGETDFGTFKAKRATKLYFHSDTKTTWYPVVDGVKKLPQDTHFSGRKLHAAKGNSGRFWQWFGAHIVKMEAMEILVNEDNKNIRQRRVK